MRLTTITSDRRTVAIPIAATSLLVSTVSLAGIAVASGSPVTPILVVIAALLAPLAYLRLSGTLAMGIALGAVVFIPGWIHLLLSPEHLDESLILGSGFLMSGLAQVGLAALAIARPRDWVLYLIVAVNVGLIAIYAYAVLVGLPFGSVDHHAAGLMIGNGEPIDMYGTITTISQITGVALALTLLGRPNGDTRMAPAARG